VNLEPIAVPVILGGLGLISLLTKRNLLGVLMGVHLLYLGAAVFFVLSGVFSGQVMQAYIFAVFIIFSSLIQIVIGHALMARFFYISKNIDMASIRTLKG